MSKAQVLLELKKSQWNKIEAFLNHWYYKPDTEAILTALSIYVSHLRLEIPPVWSFFIGPSGSGKTELVCNAIEALPYTKVVSEMSPASLISGLKTSDGGSSLLFNLTPIKDNRLETHGVLIFKDFTSIISERPDTRAKIMGQLRQVHDGNFNSIKGTATEEWNGKVTIIAAVTNAIERQWAIQRELGERFNQKRWAREDGIEIAKKALTHKDHKDIIFKYKEMIKAFVNAENLDHITEIDDVMELVYLAEMVAILRGTVVRDSASRHTIIDIPPVEAPTRLAKAMAQVAMARATILRKEKCDSDDIEAAKSLGIDSIPMTRLKIINSIQKECIQSDIVKSTKLPTSTVEWACEDLVALGVLEGKIVSNYTYFGFTDEFATLRNQAMGKGNIIEFPKLKKA